MRNLLRILPLALAAALGTARAEIYELRTYRAADGKMPALLERFRAHTTKLFEKHGMKNVGYWMPLDPENGGDRTLIYLLAHEDREAARKSWQAFGADPDWRAAAAASEADGKLLAGPPESVFLRTTDFSPPVPEPGEKADRVFELRTYTTPEGKLDDLHARFRDHTMELFEKHGMTNIAYFQPLDDQPGAAVTLIYFLAHPSQQAGLEAFGNFRADPAWIEAKAASERDGSLTAPDGVKSLYLKSTDFSPL